MEDLKLIAGIILGGGDRLYTRNNYIQFAYIGGEPPILIPDYHFKVLQANGKLEGFGQDIGEQIDIINIDIEGTGTTYTFPQDSELYTCYVYLEATSPPLGSALTVNVYDTSRAGNPSILDTLLTIPAGQTRSLPNILVIPNFNAGAVLQISVISVGSESPGAGVKLILGRKYNEGEEIDWERVGLVNTGNGYSIVLKDADGNYLFVEDGIAEIHKNDESLLCSLSNLYTEVMLRFGNRNRNGTFSDFIAINHNYLVYPSILQPENYFVKNSEGNKTFTWNYIDTTDNSFVGSSAMSTTRSENVLTKSLGWVYNYTINYQATQNPNIVYIFGDKTGITTNVKNRTIQNQTTTSETTTITGNTENKTTLMSYQSSDQWVVNNLFYTHSSTPNEYSLTEQGQSERVIENAINYLYRYDFVYSFTTNIKSFASSSGYELTTFTNHFSNTIKGFVIRPLDWQYSVSSYTTPESTRQASSGGGLKYTGTGTNWEIIEANGNVIPLLNSTAFTSEVEIVFYSYGFGNQIIPLGTYPPEFVNFVYELVPDLENPIYSGHTTNINTTEYTTERENIGRKTKLYIGNSDIAIYEYSQFRFKQTSEKIKTEQNGTNKNYYIEPYNTSLCVKINNSLYTINNFTVDDGFDYKNQFFFESPVINTTYWDLWEYEPPASFYTGVCNNLVLRDSFFSYTDSEGNEEYHSIQPFTFPSSVEIYEITSTITTKRIGAISGQTENGEYKNITISDIPGEYPSLEQVPFYMWFNVYTSGTIIVPAGDHTTSVTKYLSDHESRKNTNFYTVTDDNGNGTVELAISEQKPSNNSFGGAVLLEGQNVSVRGNNYGADQQSNDSEPELSSPTQSVWYKWVAPSSTPVTIHTLGSPVAADYQVDTVIGVYTGSSLDSLSLVASNDDASVELPPNGDYLSAVVINPTEGTTYYIQVDGWSDTQWSFVLSITTEGLNVPTPIQEETRWADIYRFDTQTLKWKRMPNAVSAISPLTAESDFISYHPTPQTETLDGTICPEE